MSCVQLTSVQYASLQLSAFLCREDVSCLLLGLRQGMKLTFLSVVVGCFVFWHLGEIMESQNEQELFPEFVCLSDDEHEVVGHDLNVSILDKTLNPEDFGCESRCVQFFISS